MAGTSPAASSSASSSSSCASFGGSFDDASALKPPGGPPASSNGGGGVKFVCSYGGRILPRRRDGRLRYVGGDTRVLSVQRSLRFSDLHRKLRELCGWGAVSVRCQLPTEDLDALVSVTGDDDLANVLEEYDLAHQDRHDRQLRIRAFLLPPAGTRTAPPAARRPPPAVQVTPSSTPSVL